MQVVSFSSDGESRNEYALLRDFSYGLKGCSIKTKPLFQDVKCAGFRSLSKAHFCTDETKISLFGHKSQCCKWRRKDETFNLKNHPV